MLALATDSSNNTSDRSRSTRSLPNSVRTRMPSIARLLTAARWKGTRNTTQAIRIASGVCRNSPNAMAWSTLRPIQLPVSATANATARLDTCSQRRQSARRAIRAVATISITHNNRGRQVTAAASGEMVYSTIRARISSATRLAAAQGVTLATLPRK